MKKFAFVSAAAEREYKELPKDVQDDFGKDLRRIQYGQDPVRPFKSLTESVGAGAIELIINGSPAFRCVYVTKFADMVVVLHSFVKTTNRSDRHAMQVAQERMKELKHELRKMGYRV
ncbi:type II toxin-antitoxin system RelE/ParE family toxin [Pseudomonas juntendi]|uniref:type II toxin-antitoxin system RelE/ParE family toxin n=1 Tax=Pseudomonas juntendi TaxID=2666183 RepID=UPI0017833CBE|nr:type II toxin-antitoxin system RelE/ParE family toxin [Pseudomonas putida]